LPARRGRVSQPGAYVFSSSAYCESSCQRMLPTPMC
jgi:hypothetical protein